MDTVVAVKMRLLTATVSIPLLAVGCGSNHAAPAVARTSSTPTSIPVSSATSIVPRSGSFERYITCMQQHGVQAQALGPQGGGVRVSKGENVSGAQSACQRYLPGGGPPALTAAELAQRAQAMLAFAKCMRKHGVANFPDPNGQGKFNNLATLGIDPMSPPLQAAGQACQSLEANVKGPRFSFG